MAVRFRRMVSMCCSPRCTDDGGGSEKSGAPICVMKMSDAPVIGAPSPYLEATYPDAKHGAVLTLTAGWEPVWTYAEVFAAK